MQVEDEKKYSYPRVKLLLAFIALLLSFQVSSFGQPVPINDNCINAAPVPIAGSGFGIGIFTSASFDLTSATVEAGETFAPEILIRGTNEKSVWFKFTLPTTRSVRVTLAQPGAVIGNDSIGFAVYNTNNCLPGNSEISTKLTPHVGFDNTFNPCVESGDYLVQVSGKLAANGPVYITVETGSPTAAYDQQSQAYNFGVLPRGVSSNPLFTIGCHSLEDAGEICNAPGNYQNYTKSTWHVFTTPAYLDYLNIVVGGYPTAAFKFGFKIYQGDVRSTPYSSLPVAWGCDSLVTDGYSYANSVLDCSKLNPNTTYSLQLLYDKNYNSQITLDLVLGGQAPTIAPEPILSAITPTTNNLGVLLSSAAGITTTASDNLACNARHSIHPCQPSLPSTGIAYNGENYKLSSFFMFSLSSTSTIQFTATVNPSYCGAPLLLRLYNQNISNSCATLDTANIINKFITSQSVPCLPPGNYTLQVMGVDTSINNRYCPKGSLGSSFTLSLTAKTTLATNKFSLATPGAFDTLNRVAGVMQPLTPGVTYTSMIDTFGCENTVLPFDVDCSTVSTKAMYREFNVPDSGLLSVFTNSALNNYFTNTGHKIYKGDANALATFQSVFTYPNTITGLTPQTLCLQSNPNPNIVGSTINTCVLPGIYTHVNFGNSNIIGESNIVQAKFDTLRTKYYDLAHPEDLGNILSIIPPAGGTISSAVDYYSCSDNAIIIDGIQPCMDPYGLITATKAIYRQFYLSSPASISILSQVINPPNSNASSPFTIFKGKATDGIAALTAMPSKYRCINELTSSECDVLAAGWYTVVTYCWGPSYSSPLRDLTTTNDGATYYWRNLVGMGNKIAITLKVPACPTPKYNRPYKAAIDTLTNQPFLIQWAPRVGHTAAYPKTDTTYTLYTENFNCANDTPFSSHPIVSCYPNAAKVAYWVFKVTQESFVSIYTDNYELGSYFAYTAMVYAGNARKDSLLFGTAQPIQPCLYSLGHIQLNRLQPGEYTLAVFAPADAVCRSVTPKIYIDQMGYSRFDHASNAYDFGKIKPDSTWYNGKPGDVNPLNSGRAPSNDFFYSTTGAQPDDPFIGCRTIVLPSIYNTGNNVPLFTSNYYIPPPYPTYPYAPARNLWYTFTVDKGGLVKVRVKKKTIGKDWDCNYVVMKSNVDGSLPFSTVVSSGGVDSTLAQGLTVVANNSQQNCDLINEEISFFRETCTPVPERYYILIANRIPLNRQTEIANPEWMYPNHQIEVEVLFDSVNSILPKFDHYYQTSNMGSNLGQGTYTGDTDNINCATLGATDPKPAPGYNCVNRTLWYKFSTSVSGSISINAFKNGVGNTGPNDIQLYREIIPGDSTSTGLQYVEVRDYACITPGTYYLLLTACDPLADGTVYPQIQINEIAGDYCSRPVLATINGAGSSITSANVGCHTIGTDYGEFNPTLTCPAGAITSQYKSSWFKINITGTDTLDVTTFLSNSTNASSSQIKYRLMNGNCGAMQERSCVQDAQTQDTYKCLAPGDYWVQVFTPVMVGSNAVIGSINLNLSAVQHADTCAPINSCLSNANFQKQFDCTQSRAVQFINYSTYGSSVSYLWDFGYNGQTSTAVAPQFIYPALSTSQKYYITLTVTNNSCGGISTFMDSITIPASPSVNLGADTSSCSGNSVVLNATSYPGATYLWSTGATSPTYTASAPGQISYSVLVTYNGCIARDTIRVNIDTISPRKINNYICGVNAVLLDAARNSGEAHSWSTGATGSSINVFNPGIYWDDISLRGCVSRDSFIVATSVYPLGSDRQACFGTQPVILNATATGAIGYSWQNGSTNTTFTAPSAGLYWVDVSFVNCTLRDTIVLSNLQPVLGNINASICQGQTYTLPSGMVVNTQGVYSDTIRLSGGCDSLINSVDLSVQAATISSSNATICSGQSYTLPWGTVVNTAGVYKDTLRYSITNCDSVLRTVNLAVQTATSVTTNASICSGQSYTLPWGTIVNTSGIYRDTLKYINSGCDSIYLTVNLTVQTSISSTTNATICAGQTYTLPWGTVVNTAGVYKDTLHYSITNCDSVIRTVNLTVQKVLLTITNAAICSGQNYTLPWGTVVSTSGVYSDTLRYAITNCDSVIKIVNLAVQTATSVTTNASICSGQSYTLPWGTVVNTAGVYKDTSHYSITNCDSVIRTVNLMVQTSASTITNATICSGQSYTLPWGVVVNTAGVYKDTLHYSITNCDSVIRTVNLTVQTVLLTITNAAICSGQNYTLPWGAVVNTAGVYSDTLRYANTNCDSVIKVVNLAVQTATSFTTNATICSGQSYTLPWGTIVNISGVYRDTLKYVNSGCDSIYRTVNLTVQTFITTTTNATICAGQSYTLPWGVVVNTSGVYGDTLRYRASGCDSVRRIVQLTVNPVNISSANATICSGNSYILPWGIAVNTAGIYKDTLHYSITNCDSLIRIINLSVTPAAVINSNASICAGESYLLPWGLNVSTTGVYKDTLRTAFNCDSLVRTVNLTVNPLPVISIAKSNDIDCILGISKLTASGGASYLWQPAGSLTNPSISNPVASPTVTTLYTVKATSRNGCSKQDSILVGVNKNGAENGFLLPSAFTPNGDGENDCFGIRSWGTVTNLKFKIYSRWGELLFSTTDPSRCWDGTYKGVQLSSAAFIYQIWADTFCGRIFRKGTITLIR